MPLIHKVKKTIQQYRLIKPGDTIVVGVSGGPDSVALLHILNRLRHDLGIKILIAHINHRLRKGADADERFVQRLCASLELACVTVHLKIRDSRQKGSVEEWAREKRLAALIRIAKRKKADAIALAHHQDDLAETVLMRILRGSGLLGLQGFLPKREITGFPIIRPFIEMKRKDIELFIKQNKIKFRTDPTNKQTRFFRNKIRLKLLPLLEKQYNRNAKEVLAHLANNAAVDYHYLQREGERLLKKISGKYPRKNRITLQLASFTRQHPSLQRMMIRLAIDHLKGSMNRIALIHMKEIEDLLKNRPSGSIVNLPGGICVEKKKVHLILTLRKT